MQIKSIDTEYKGYYFRSRLEARWAVFMDTLGLEWKYELEGFEFENGLRYLPDFYLPRFDLYLEIKPDFPDDDDMCKIRSFYDAGKAVAIGIDLPGTKPLYLMVWDDTDSSGGCCELEANFIEKDYKIYIEVERNKDATYFSDVGMQHSIPEIIRKHQYDYRWVEHAAKQAKQARFEFGETPS